MNPEEKLARFGHNVPPTPDEAAAFATQVVMNALAGTLSHPNHSYNRYHFRPGMGQSWGHAANAAGQSLSDSAHKTAISQGMSEEDWGVLRASRVDEDAASLVVYDARLLAEAAKYEHPNVVRTRAGWLLESIPELKLM